jgi:hypothetical protein
VLLVCNPHASLHCQSRAVTVGKRLGTSGQSSAVPLMAVFSVGDPVLPAGQHGVAAPGKADWKQALKTKTPVAWRLGCIQQLHREKARWFHGLARLLCQNASPSRVLSSPQLRETRGPPGGCTMGQGMAGLPWALVLKMSGCLASVGHLSSHTPGISLNQTLRVFIYGFCCYNKT